MMIYQFCRLFYRFGLRLTLILAPWRSQPRHNVASPIRIRQAAAIPRTSGAPWLPLSAQSLPVYLPASCCACACLAAVEVRQGRRPLLLGLRRRPRPVGALSAAAAPRAHLHRQTPPFGPQGSSLRHGVPGRVHPSAREAIPASATASGPRRRPIPDGAPCVAVAPLPLPSAPLVRGVTPPRPFARGADPRSHRSDVPPRPSRGARPQRRASAPPPLCAARPWRHNPVAVRAGR